MEEVNDHTPLTDLLAEVRRLDGEATEGPWEAETWEVRPSPLARARSASIGGTSPSPSYNGTVDVIDCDGVYGVTSGYDAAFIALARTALPALAAAVEAVMEMHRPDQPGDIEVFCVECKVSTPCPTIRALNEAMGGGDDE